MKRNNNEDELTKNETLTILMIAYEHDQARRLWKEWKYEIKYVFLLICQTSKYFYSQKSFFFYIPRRHFADGECSAARPEMGWYFLRTFILCHFTIDFSSFVLLPIPMIGKWVCCEKKMVKNFDFCLHCVIKKIFMTRNMENSSAISFPLSLRKKEQCQLKF